MATSSCCQGLAGDTNHFQAGLLSCRCDAGLQGTLNMIAQPLPTQNVKVCAPAAWPWGECPSSPQISCSKAEGRCGMAGLTPQHGYKISRDDFGGAELCRAPRQLLFLLRGGSVPCSCGCWFVQQNSSSVRLEFLPNWLSPTPGKIPALPQLWPQFCCWERSSVGPAAWKQLLSAQEIHTKPFNSLFLYFFFTYSCSYFTFLLKAGFFPSCAVVRKPWWGRWWPARWSASSDSHLWQSLHLQ